MKRVISFVIAALMAVNVFAGCGTSSSGSDSSSESSAASSNSDKEESSSSSESKESSKVDLNEILDKINSETGLSIDKLDDVSRLKRYYDIDEEDVKQFAVERDKDNEVALIEAVDGDAASRIEECLQNKLDSLVNLSNSYSPEKAEQVKSCKVTKDGNFVTLIVTDNAETALKVFKDSI